MGELIEKTKSICLIYELIDLILIEITYFCVLYN